MEATATIASATITLPLPVIIAALALIVVATVITVRLSIPAKAPKAPAVIPVKSTKRAEHAKTVSPRNITPTEDLGDLVDQELSDDDDDVSGDEDQSPLRPSRSSAAPAGQSRGAAVTPRRSQETSESAPSTPDHNDSPAAVQTPEEAEESRRRERRRKLVPRPALAIAPVEELPVSVVALGPHGVNFATRMRYHDIDFDPTNFIKLAAPGPENLTKRHYSRCGGRPRPKTGAKTSSPETTSHLSRSRSRDDVLSSRRSSRRGARSANDVLSSTRTDRKKPRHPKLKRPQSSHEVLSPTSRTKSFADRLRRTRSAYNGGENWQRSPETSKPRTKPPGLPAAPRC